MSSFLERLGRERLYCDGGTGSFLQTRGLKGGELPERWNLTRPEDVIALARAYFEAGSDIVNTNTFGANSLHYPDPEELDAIVKAGVRHVREGMRLAGREDGFVALDIGPTGKLIEPMGDLGFEEAVELFARIVRSGASGADLVMIETMGDTLEIKAAVLAAKENCDLPVCVTTAYNQNGHLFTGAGPESVVLLLEGLGVDALGMNCGIDPVLMLPVAQRIAGVSSVPVICNPNAGPPKLESGQAVYDLTAEEFALAMQKIASCGIQVLGGCCGTTPEYIRRTIEMTRRVPYAASSRKQNSTLVCSPTKVVDLAANSVRIGMLHPSSGEEFRQALLEKDLDTIVDLGFEQEDDGANVLLVGTHIPGIDEAAMLEEVVVALQSSLSLPLILASSDPDAVERALRRLNGIAAVDGEESEKMEKILHKYGAIRFRT